ncbi:MAG TPA: hypothetical protein HA257_03880 [Candidatus Methanoperedenaceae archaeon]|nr:hypothetical protein [Candidatus Methanoperedenaceae archaeon]
MITVRVSALINPTELEEKVEAAVRNIFSELETHVEPGEKPRLSGTGTADSLKKLHELLRAEKILDTARSVLIRGKRGELTEFCIGKQVAFAGRANFSDDESLGSIYVEIQAGSEAELMHLIDWLAPSTVDGRPVEEIEL